MESPGDEPNHSSSSVREEVIEWSVSSANLRFRGVFHVPGCNGGEDSSLIGGVGIRGRRLMGWILTGAGGGNAFARESFVYILATVKDGGVRTISMHP